MSERGKSLPTWTPPPPQTQGLELHLTSHRQFSISQRQWSTSIGLTHSDMTVLSLLTRFGNSVAVEQRYEQFFADGSSMVGGLNLHPTGNYDFHYSSTVSA